jgi:hypothetical protein
MSIHNITGIALSARARAVIPKGCHHFGLWINQDITRRAKAVLIGIQKKGILNSPLRSPNYFMYLE